MLQKMKNRIPNAFMTLEAFGSYLKIYVLYDYASNLMSNKN